MAIWQRYNVKQPITDRAPDKESLLPWAQKEGWSFFRQVRLVLNWAVGYLGKVGIDADDVPDVAELKLLAGAGVTVTKGGAPGARALTFTTSGVGPGADDHLVIATEADVTSPGALDDKLDVENGLSKRTATVGGTQKVIIGGPTIAPPDPVISASTLYTAKVGDPRYREDCKCHLHSGYGAAFIPAEWTNITGTSSYVRNNPGPITGWLVGGLDTLPLYAGDRIYVPGDDSLLGGPNKYIGIYEVIEPGDNLGTYSVIRRALDATTPEGLSHGMAVKVVNGIYGPPDYPVIDTADPIVVDTTAITLSSVGSWSTPPYGSTDKFEALTGPQLTSEGAQTTTLEMSATVDSSGGPTFFAETAMPNEFVTLAGTPGVNMVQAGVYKWGIEWARASGGDPGSLTVIRAYLIDVDHVEAPVDILYANSTPITSDGGALSFIETLVVDYAFAPDRRLQLKYAARTNSVSPVTVTMRYNSAARGTKITLPFTIAVSGASDGIHNHLSGRDDVNNHFGVCSLTTASGIIPVPTKRVALITVSGSTVMLGMMTTGLENGVSMELTFLQDCSIVGEAGGLPAGAAKFRLTRMEPPSPDNIDPLYAGGRIGVTYFASAHPDAPCFQLTWGPLS